ncbi:hypothetical protein QQS21_012405 [Conoideocrella luteorostrata]|uniref:Cell wall protein n=1 Tax=Conoideocrella luteorostrata TaxID=1105319 RepID=A0AAJ0CB91_9HYPO|nr:hypothetical protein QQS21_012405 [Conoideocrella luteorostrata]
MKFSVAIACLAAGALASLPPSRSLFERDIKTITDILDHVKSDITNLGSTVKNATDDPTPLLLASNALIKTITDAKPVVDALPELTLVESIGLTRPVQALTKLGSDLTKNLKDLRERVKKLGECDVVRLQLNAIVNGSEALTASVVSKVPHGARVIADKLSAGLTKVLQQSQDDFSEKNCVNFGPPNPVTDSSTSGSSPSLSARYALFGSAGALVVAVAAHFV